VIAVPTKNLPPVAAAHFGRFDPNAYETFDESGRLYRDGSSIVVSSARAYFLEAVGHFRNLSQTQKPARACFTKSLATVRLHTD